MLSKRTLFLLSVAISISACTEKIIPNKKISLQEDKIRFKAEITSSESMKPISTNRHTIQHFDIQKLIYDESYEEAKNSLERELYGEKSHQKEIYISPSYIGYLGLYAILLKKLNSLPNHHKGKIILSTSLDKFYNHFLRDCLTKEESACEILKSSLSKEILVVDILLMLSGKEINPIRKIKILEAAFDISGDRRIKPLEESYLQTGLTILDGFERGKYRITKKKARQHLHNILTISKRVKWSQTNRTKISQFNLIQPWKYNSNGGDVLRELRKELLPFLPIYINLNQRTKESVKSFVEKKIKQLTENQENSEQHPSYRGITPKDLDQYPAYEGFSIKRLKTYPIEISYLTLGVHFQEIGVMDANTYVSLIENKEEFMDQALEASKILALWDVAQLSIHSTEKLQWKFSQQEAKTQALLQDTLDWSKTLIPLWSEFHTGRAFTSRSFLDSNAKYSRHFSEIDVQEFFLALNRSILKTTVYPNMMAFAYYMEKTEWSATIRVLWFTVNLNTSKIINHMMTGQYQKFWFNFTNLKKSYEFNSKLETKRTLFRSEMYDALYYFFTTKTFQIYKINADDFLSSIGESIIKKRRTRLELNLKLQKDDYFANNSQVNYLKKWCEGIKTGLFEKENIHFYSLSQHITPIEKSFNAEVIITHGVERDYFSETIDRYRLEFKPILHTLNQYVSITERIDRSSPNLNIGSLSQIKKQIRDLDLLMMTYLGIQKMVEKNFGHCAFIGSRESKRRAIDVTFAHEYYFSKVVHPLMAAIQYDSLSVDQANTLLCNFHTSSWDTPQEACLDKFEVSSSGNNPIFMASFLTYMLRTRGFLISGKHFSGQQFSRYTKQSFSLPPVVGSHLDIFIPPNFMNDPGNFYSLGSININPMAFHFEEDPSNFSQSVSSAITGAEVRTGTQYHSSRLIDWYREDFNMYLLHISYNLRYEATVLQIPEQKYIDIEKPHCFTYTQGQVKDDCIATDKPDIRNIIEKIAGILDFYILDEKQRKYMNLTTSDSWIGSSRNNAYAAILKFDIDTPYDNETNGYPYQTLSGVFDTIYEMIEADYLGSVFKLPWNTRIKGLSKSDHKGEGRSTCEDYRDRCRWKNERFQAREFFFSRTKRPKIVFNYDLQIIADDFEYQRSRIRAKYDLLRTLNDQSDELLKYLKKDTVWGPFEDYVWVSMSKDPSELIPLSPYYSNTQIKFEKFFKEETEGFFLKENHDWDNFVIQ